MTGIKSFIQEFLKGVGIEVAEEVSTEVVNILADEAIMGDKSHYELAVKGYMEGGLSRGEAEKKRSWM